MLSGFLAVAYFMGHASRGHALLPMLNQGELAVAWSFLFLYFSVAGGRMGAREVGAKPRVVVTISGHWEEGRPTVQFPHHTFA